MMRLVEGERGQVLFADGEWRDAIVVYFERVAPREEDDKMWVAYSAPDPVRSLDTIPLTELRRLLDDHLWNTRWSHVTNEQLVCFVALRRTAEGWRARPTRSGAYLPEETESVCCGRCHRVFRTTPFWAAMFPPVALRCTECRLLEQYRVTAPRSAG